MAHIDQFVWEALLCTLAGLVAVIPFFFFNVKYARPLGLIDWPKARGLAEDHVPIIGPSLILVAFATLGVLMAFFPVSPWVVTSAAIIGLMGYYDDRRSVPVLDKLFFQTVCSAAVVCLDPRISSMLTQQYGGAGLVLGALFIIGVMNSINFVDGIDGLAGLALLTSFGVLPFMANGHSAVHPYIIFSWVMVGGLLPFLYLNVIRRRGFLGNTGSYFFSFLVAVGHLSVPLESSGSLSRFALAGLCFLVPFSDAMTVISMRLWSGRSPFRPDKGHLHHRLVQTNIPLRYTLLVFGMVQTLGALTSLFLAQPSVVGIAHLPVVIFVGYSAITATLIILLEKASRLRVQSYFQRLDSGDPIYYLKYRVDRTDKGQVSMAELLRLEAKFATEIRVTDICVAQDSNCLFIVLRTMAEPLKGISARLEAVISSERLYEFNLIERGDFTKRLTPTGIIKKSA